MKKQYNKKVKFSFNDGVIFDGLSNGTKWNGFDNVIVNEETHLLIIENLARTYHYDFEDMFSDVFGLGQGGQLPLPQPKINGYYSYANGFTTSIVSEFEIGLVTHNEKNVGVGGHLQGYVKANYDVLVKLFGKPMEDCDYKTDAEWAIEFEDGLKCCIYNWKDGKNYLGDNDGLEVWEIMDWHIGGTNADKECVDRIQKIVINEQKKYEKLLKSRKTKTINKLEKKAIDSLAIIKDYMKTLTNDDDQMLMTLSAYTLKSEELKEITEQLQIAKHSSHINFRDRG